MLSLASYYGSEAYHGRVLSAVGEFFGRSGNFACSGHPDNINLLIGRTVTLEAVYGSGEQLGGNEFVESADDYRETAFAGLYLALDFVDHFFASPKKSSFAGGNRQIQDISGLELPFNFGS